MKNVVIINEQHKLFIEQEEILRSKFQNYEILTIPAEGWTIEEIPSVMKELSKEAENIIFASPVPILLMKLAYAEGEGMPIGIWVFHNDNREKKELPNGNIISTISQTGWQLVTNN